MSFGPLSCSLPASTYLELLVIWGMLNLNVTKCPKQSKRLRLRPLLLLGKSYANEKKCKQWRQQRFAYSRMLVVSSLRKRPKSEQNKREKLRDSVKTQGEASSIRN